MGELGFLLTDQWRAGSGQCRISQGRFPAAWLAGNQRRQKGRGRKQRPDAGGLGVALLDKLVTMRSDSVPQASVP